MVSEATLWRRAARIWGIQTDFLDAKKKLIPIPLENLKKVLHGVTEEEFLQSKVEDIIQAGRERKIFRLLNPVQIVRRGKVSSSLFLPASAKVSDLRMQIRKESGERIQIVPRFTKSHKEYLTKKGIYHRWHFECFCHLEMGYHFLETHIEGKRFESFLLVPPEKSKISDSRLLGLFSPLYALSGTHSWGIGDLRDLYQLQKESENWGVDFIGTLPLLATIYEGPSKDLSPYAPCSKLFWNEIYLHVPELLKEDMDAALKEEIFKLNSLEWVDYESVYHLKKRILQQLSLEFFSRNTLPADYEQFLNEKPLIHEYARHRGKDSEQEYQYHLFVQYQMHRQMKNLGKNLYLDFPVGVHSHGFDTAYFSRSFLRKMNVGAPPDIFYAHGQNWGFSPLNPHMLRENFYEYFILTLRHHMQNSSILRLDHVMALHRLYVIPENGDATKGSYLRYNGEELFAIVDIEATRHKVKVVGENLGTVPDRVQELLVDYGVLGMWIMAFDGGTHPIEAIKKIPAKNLAAFSTHDMLPFAGYVKENDISAWKRDFFERSPSTLFAKMLAKMAQSPAEIFLINIEDLWFEERPQNKPGNLQYPNWQKKLRYPLEKWIENQDISSFINHLSELRNERRFHEHLIEIRRSLSLQ